jgi:hypothetical protein
VDLRTLLAYATTQLLGLTHEALSLNAVTLKYDELLDAAGLEAAEVAVSHGGPRRTPFSKSR